MQKYDVLIVGAGASGMRAALSASEDDELTIAVLSKVAQPCSHTAVEQEPILAVPDKRPTLAQAELGQSPQTLYDQCLQAGIRFLYEWMMLSLVVDKGKLCGITAIHISSGAIHGIQAKTVVIATGNYTSVYASQILPGKLTTGDGTAACLEAGIALMDPELTLFQPVGLASGNTALVEACRKAGGYFLNSEHERFMQRYAPAEMELAAIDVVTCSIESEIAEDRGCGVGAEAYVYLDLRYLGEQQIAERLPVLRELVLELEGVDIACNLIPVRAGCVKTLGGIQLADEATCETTIAGVYVAGEAASWVSPKSPPPHVEQQGQRSDLSGKMAGMCAGHAAQARRFIGERRLKAEARRWAERFTKMRFKTSGNNLMAIRTAMVETMRKHVGSVRDAAGVKQALATLDQLLRAYEDTWIGDSAIRYNMSFVHYVEIGQLLRLAKAIAMGALARLEYRDLHQREDHLLPDDQQPYTHTLITKRKEGYRIEYLP